jgi:hypothetical protein
MAGAITQHARFRLAQLTTMASEAAADVVRLQKDLDEITARYASTQNGSVWRDLQLATEARDKATAVRDGSKHTLERFRAKMESPEFQAQLAEADELEQNRNALDFAAQFGELGPRIEAAAKELASLIPEVMQLVNDHAGVERDLILALERCNFHELAASSILDQETGLARFRETTAAGFRSTRLDESVLRAALGWRP